MPRSPASPDDLTDSLVQLAFATMAVLTRIAAEHDLSLTQLRVLAILRDRQPRMADLASYLGLERSTMSGLIERAERRGLVQRLSSATDGRVVEVALTEQGSQLARRIGRKVAGELRPLAASLSADERTSLTRPATLIDGPVSSS